MKEKLHDKISNEIQQQNKSDSLFTIFSILINFAVLFINWFFATKGGKTTSEIIVFFFLIGISIAISVIGILSVLNGKKIHMILFQGISKLYIDEKLDNYYPIKSLEKHSKRNNYYVFFILITGILSVLMPIILYE